MSHLYDLKDCAKVLKATISHNQAFPFLEPVDWVALAIPTYPQVIKHPMDFGTIGKRLKSGHYTSSKGFMDDMELVFSNAKTFNQKGSDIYVMTENVENAFKNALKKIPVKSTTVISLPVVEPRCFTDQEKRDLGKGIANLSSKNLETVIQLIVKHKPTLIKDTTTQIELDISNLDDGFLTELHQHVSSCKKKKRSKDKDGQPPAKKRKLNE